MQASYSANRFALLDEDGDKEIIKPKKNRKKKKTKPKIIKKTNQDDVYNVEFNAFGDDFPIDLVFHIFTYLDHIDICSLERVNKTFYKFFLYTRHPKTQHNLWYHLSFHRGYINSEKLLLAQQKVKFAKNNLEKWKRTLELCTTKHKHNRIKKSIKLSEARLEKAKQNYAIQENLVKGQGFDFKKKFKENELELLGYISRTPIISYNTNYY